MINIFDYLLLVFFKINKTTIHHIMIIMSILTTFLIPIFFIIILFLIFLINIIPNLMGDFDPDLTSNNIMYRRKNNRHS
jgi:hypothetical protein